MVASVAPTTVRHRRPATVRPVRPSQTGWSISRERRAAAERRMYLQRRIAVLLLAVVLTALGSLIMFGNGGVSADLDPSSPVQTYRVRPGDTLWSIAGALDLPGDRRAVVKALVEANGGDVVRAGDEIVIPPSLGTVR